MYTFLIFCELHLFMCTVCKWNAHMHKVLPILENKLPWSSKEMDKKIRI
jgi:hypothetical protein